MNAATLFVIIVRENALVEEVVVFQDRGKAVAFCQDWASNLNGQPGPAMEEVGQEAWKKFWSEPWTCDWWDEDAGNDYFIDIHEVELADPDPVMVYLCSDDHTTWRSDEESRCPGCGNGPEQMSMSRIADP